MNDKPSPRDDSLPVDPHHPRHDFQGSDGIATTVIVTLLILGVVGFLRPVRRTGVPKAAFWQQKVHWSHVADIVVAGDSRIHFGISPAAMQRALPEQRIYNFGFDGCGYSPKYLEAVAAMLAEDDSQKAIVLGITPLSLTEKSMLDNGFLSRLESPSKLHPPAWLARALTQLEPMTFREAYDLARSYGSNDGFYVELHPDGWAASDLVPANPGLSLKSYREEFTASEVTERNLKRVLEFVQKMTAQGVHVYGVQLPIHSELLQVEQECTNFDYADFSRRFMAAGGIWIDIDDGSYETYDGSHLRAPSAAMFSERLGEEIARHEAASF